MATSFKHFNDVMDRRVASMQLFVLYFFLGLVQVCEIEISHMGKNSRNPGLVFENIKALIDRLNNKYNQMDIAHILLTISKIRCQRK